MQYANNEFEQSIPSDYLREAYHKLPEFQKEQARLKTIRKMIHDEISREHKEQERIEKTKEIYAKYDKMCEKSYEPIDYTKLYQSKQHQRNSQYFL
jgi:hypothetical protein